MKRPIDPRTLPTKETVYRGFLSDGSVLLIRPNLDSPAVVLQGLVFAGAADEPVERLGISRFLAEAMTRGTNTRTAGEIHEIADSLGASFGVSGGLHTTRFGLKCLREDAAVMIELLADVLRNPSFAPDEVERLRGETLTELEESRYSTRYVADLAFRELTFPKDHPYSRSYLGTEETISAFDSDALHAHFARTVPYRPMIIAVTGCVEPDAIRAMMESHWPQPHQREARHDIHMPDVMPRTEPDARHVEIRGKAQIDLAWGGIGPRRNEPDYVAATVANVVLGGFGLMGRLGQAVREEQGLAYYATSRLSAGLARGPWHCLAGVAPHDFYRAVASIRDEVERMRSEPVPDQELEDCKSYVTGSLPLKLESNEGMANIMTEIELYELGWDYLLRFHDEVGSVNQNDITAVMRRWFEPDTAILASAGPAPVTAAD